MALQDPETDRLLARIPQAERKASWHLVRPGGGVRSAGAAFVPLAQLLPGARLFGAVAGRFPRTSERVYRLVAEHRSGLGRLVTRGADKRARRRIEARS